MTPNRFVVGTSHKGPISKTLFLLLLLATHVPIFLANFYTKSKQYFLSVVTPSLAQTIQIYSLNQHIKSGLILKFKNLFGEGFMAGKPREI